MSRIWTLALLAASISFGAHLPEDRGAAGLWQALKRANNPVRVLYVIAHPDDEDSGTLTWLARGRGAHVTLLSLTRGESGANLITGDFFDELGALRTLEHQRATAQYGVDLRYTRFADFGFSKNVEETWRNWDHRQILGEVVAVVRAVRPHIIMARFSGTPRDGHGHHQASGILAQEAFRAAADPAEFPGSGPAWQASKLYAGSFDPSDPGRIGIDSGEYDPVLGRSYAEIGREGYRWHRSQAMGAVLARPGPSISYYRRVDAPGAGGALFDGLDTGRLAIPFDAGNPAASAPALAEALRQVPDSEDLQRALGLALALELEARVAGANPPTGMAAQFRPAPTFRVATPGQRFRVSANFYSRLAVPGVQNVEMALLAPLGWRVERAAGTDEFTVIVPNEPNFSAAGWSRPSLADTRYQGTPTLPAALIAELTYRFQGVSAKIHAPVQVSYLDSIGLEHREPLAIGPAVAVRFATRAGYFPKFRDRYETEVVVRNVGDGTREGRVRLELPAGWTAEPAEAPFRFAREGEEQRIVFQVASPKGAPEGEGVLRAAATAAGVVYRSSFERTTYAGLDSLYLAHAAEHRVRLMDLRIAPGIRAGYVMGSGDEVPATLKQFGIPVQLLTPADLASGDLSRFTVILLGIRAYAARDDVRTHNGRLLEYVKNGGSLIVQYNTQEYDHNFGPYPYSMTARAEETSEENAPVTILAPSHPFFTTPNVITPKDFDGWFEQRGSKFWTTWDPQYTPLIETHDTGQAPQKGVWLSAAYGKGRYVYCALAWYRQLPQAIPGAARLFANLLSPP